VFMLGAKNAYRWTQNEMAGQCIDLSDMRQWTRWWLLELQSHREWHMGVTLDPWIEASVHGMEAHITANK
jgi:hypothetical protein